MCVMRSGEGTKGGREKAKRKSEGGGKFQALACWQGRPGASGKITSLIYSSNAAPHKAGHSVSFPLAQRFQLAAEHLVWGDTG